MFWEANESRFYKSLLLKKFYVCGIIEFSQSRPSCNDKILDKFIENT